MPGCPLKRCRRLAALWAQAKSEDEREVIARNLRRQLARLLLLEGSTLCDDAALPLPAVAPLPPVPPLDLPPVEPLPPLEAPSSIATSPGHRACARAKPRPEE